MAKPLVATSTIYDAALELLGAQGPNALTARNLAARLRCSTRTLYQQVGKREALIEKLVEYHLAALPVELDQNASWQANATAWADTLRNALRDHPNLYQLITSEHRAPIVNYVNALFKTLVQAGFTEGLALRSCRTLVNVTITLTLSELKTQPPDHGERRPRGQKIGQDDVAMATHRSARASSDGAQPVFAQTIAWLIAGIEADHAQP